MTRVDTATNLAVLKPLYSQVRDMLATRISAGEWGPGAMLPNETTLATSFGVSIGTIRRAVEGLEDMGLVVRKQGRGTYVGGLGGTAAADRLSRLRGASGAALKLTWHIDEQFRRVATAAEIVRLQLSGPSEVLEIRTIVSSRNVRIGIETSVLPGIIASSLTRPPEGGLSLYALLGASGHLVTSVEEQISAGEADEAVARILRAPARSPLLEVRRLALGIDQRPVELRHGRYLGLHVGYANRIV
jgi:GntR family transcriptional regulator